MRILFASAEIYPLSKTGGLADVSAALPAALRELGADIELVLPGYPRALSMALDKSVAAEFLSEHGHGQIRLISARMPDSGLAVWLVDCPALYDRPGNPYQDEHGEDWADNAQRFAAFCQVTAKLAAGELLADWRADVVHANDWHTGLVPVLLNARADQTPRTLFTIHNLAYQGLFPSSVMPSIGMPGELFTPDGTEFYGKFSFLKAGIRFSERVTTVSPSYAREIMSAEHGCGLDGLLRRRRSRVAGILNGVDYRVWNPPTDCYLPANFGIGDLSGKRVCKAELQRELGLDVDPGIPLVVWLSRITEQKMADVVTDALHMILHRDVQLAVLGEGDPSLEGQLHDAAGHHRGRLAVRIGYDESLAHRFQAGGDLLLHPSRFEPCGLTPLYAMRYGTLPIVRYVGGLMDTVVDATDWAVRADSATGFAFREPTAAAMLECLDRALTFYRRNLAWSSMQRRAMSREFGWAGSARRYLALYDKLAPAAELDDVDRDVTSAEVLETPALRSIIGTRASEQNATVKQAA
jgi:starch synthase